MGESISPAKTKEAADTIAKGWATANDFVPMRKHIWLELTLVVAITAIAVFLRYYQIDQVPPGFNSDEAVGAVGALETLRTGPQYHSAGPGGGGSLGFLIAAIGFAIFGPSIASIRGTAAFAGVIGVVATYFATREMFRASRSTYPRLLAMLAALGLAVSLWHTRSSRIAFAAVGVPFLQVPGNYFLWRGLNTGRRVHFVISGVLLASLMYIYLSGSFAPLVYLAFFLFQGLVVAVQSKTHPSERRAAFPSLLKQHVWNLVICAGVAFVLFLPMLYFYLTAPEVATERAQQALFTNPLINQGDPWGLLWRSIGGNLAAFGLSTSWLRGYPPANLVMPVPVSLLFLLGFVISLWRVRQPAYLFTLVYWALMLVPSILSPDSIPHTLRAVGAAPATYILVAVGAVGFINLGFQALERTAQVVGWGVQSGSTYIVRKLQILWAGGVLLALGVVVTPSLYRDFHYYMVEWPKTNDAQAAFHVYAVELAAEMSKETNPRAVFLLPRDTAAGDINPNYTVMFLYTGQAGYAWVVDNEDTLETTLNDAVQDRDLVHVVRWKTSKHTGADPKDIIRYYLEKHGSFIESRSFEYFDIESYQLDRLGPDLTDGPLSAAILPGDRLVDFGGKITLTADAFGDTSGVERIDEPSVPAGELLWVRLRLRLTAPTDEDLKASITVADDAGHIVGQIDKLLLNNILHQGSTQWGPDTEVDAYFLIPIASATAPGDYRLGVAIYGANSLVRLPTLTGDPGQVVTLGTVAVRPDLSPASVEALGMSLVLNQPVTEELTLLGFSAATGEALRPGERASIALIWRAEKAPSDDYRASIWATRTENAWPLTDSRPLAGVDYPSSRWGAGQLVRGWFDGRLPPEMDSGDYTLSVRVADSQGTLVVELPLGSLHAQGRPRQFDVPPMQVTVGTSFGDQIELLGYDLRRDATLDVILYWRALREMDISYTTFVHVLDGADQVVSQVDHVPGGGVFPTTGWLPNEVISDPFVVPLPESMPPAGLQIEVGIYDPVTGERLSISDQADSSDHLLLPSDIPISE
jgi:4-amino-4-deoxy-L-arabinose transferase-like glycosyltransferase